MGDETTALLIDDEGSDFPGHVTNNFTDDFCMNADSTLYSRTSVSVNSDERDLDQATDCKDTRLVAPELPTGKHAHMFISYSSEDRDTVLPLIYSMEQEFGVRCIFDERDFQPGMQIHENIKYAMDCSMKVLLFLSENFTKSGYCNYEKDLAFIMSLENGGNNVIPVKLEECRIPSTLKTLTYIDATVEEEDLPKKIVEAFNRTDACEVLPFWAGNPSSILENGFFIDIPCDVERSCPSYPKVEEAVIDDSTRLMIHSAKFKAPFDTFQRALDIVNKFRLRGRWPRYDCRVQLCLSCCLMLFIPVTVFLWIGICGGSATDNDAVMFCSSEGMIAAVVLCFTLPGLIPVTVYIYYKCRQGYDLKQLDKELFQNVTMESYRDGTLFEISSRRTKCNEYVTLRAIRYDTLPCCKYLARYIKTRVEEKLGRELDQPEIFRELADGQIKLHLYRLMTADTPFASVTRHPVKGGKSCYCQMLEPHIHDGYVDGVCNTYFRMRQLDTI